LNAPNSDRSAIKRRSKALTEYEVPNDALYRISGKNNRGKRVLEHGVFDIIAHTHDVLLHVGKNKTYARINEKYHGNNPKEV